MPGRNKTEGTEAPMDAIEAIKSRRSLRHCASAPVDEKTVAEVLDFEKFGS
jgi:hypothetical protein